MRSYEFLCSYYVLLALSLVVRSGGGTPLYKPYRYVSPKRVWLFSSCFGLKTGINFDNFGIAFKKKHKCGIIGR